MTCANGHEGMDPLLGCPTCRKIDDAVLARFTAKGGEIKWQGCWTRRFFLDGDEDKGTALWFECKRAA